MRIQAPIGHVALKIDGQFASADLMADLLEVVVDASLHLPAACSLRLYCQDMRWLEDPTFREGRKIEVVADSNRPTVLFTGKVAAIEPELRVAEPTLVVRGYDLSHQLYRGRHRRSFKQVTDADLVRKVAAEAGLRLGTVETTREVHEYVFQNNQTNAEFLLERARRVGYDLWVADERLHFGKPARHEAALTLAWGDDLLDFTGRLSTAEQVSEVEVRGWDPKRKQAVVGLARRGDGAPRIGETRPGAAIAEQAWGEARYAVVDEFVRSPGEAGELAQAILDEMAASFVEADGVCREHPEIMPGRQVTIQGVGERFGGTYYVTQAVHEWTRDGGFTTRFAVSGRRDRGVVGMLRRAARAAPAVGSGFVVGLVTNNRDPEELGRVKVRFPWLESSGEGTWARLVAPMTGDGRGVYFLPEVDDEVLVGFEHGDIHRPFVVGSLWNGKDATPLAAARAVGGDGRVNQRIVKSRSGHTILLDDTDGRESITIADKTGKNRIVFQTPTNAMQIQVDGDLTIETQGKIIMKAKTGFDVTTPAQFKLAADTGADVSTNARLKLAGRTGAELSTPAQLQLSGTAGAELTTDAQLKLSGLAGAELTTTAQLKLSGVAGAELGSTGQATVKGSAVTVQGTGPVTIQGAGPVSVTAPLIRLN